MSCTHLQLRYFVRAQATIITITNRRPILAQYNLAAKNERLTMPQRLKLAEESLLRVCPLQAQTYIQRAHQCMSFCLVAVTQTK